MTIDECPGCRHPRQSHDGGSCFHLVDAVTAGGEIHPTMCGFCPWTPFLNHNGVKAWRHVVGVEPDLLKEGAGEAAIAEVERWLGLKS